MYKLAAMVIKARVPLLFTILISSLLLGSVSLTLGDDRYDYDQCARRCADKPAHERQVCVAACSRRRHRPDERTVDPRHEIEQCRRRCEKQETGGERCRKRCEDLYGDRGRESAMINPSRYHQDQFEQQCEKRCVLELGEQKQLQCHQRCVELTKEQKQCQRRCKMQERGDHEQCQRTCMQQLEEQVRKQQEQIGGGGDNPQRESEILRPKLSSEEGEMYVLEGLNM